MIEMEEYLAWNYKDISRQEGLKKQKKTFLGYDNNLKISVD